MKFRLRGRERMNMCLRRFQRGAVILCYHRVTTLARDPQLLSVSPRNFRQQLEALRYLDLDVVPLQDWVTGLPRRRRSVILTFDDGYADNLENALPILRAASCRATIFVTTGKVGDPGEFWWDELERLLLEPTDLPDLLSLSIDDKHWEWGPGLNCPEVLSGGAWNVLSDAQQSPRQKAYVALCGLLRYVSAAERSEILDTIRQWAKRGSEGRSTHRALTASELRELSLDTHIEIGAHTVTHSSLGSVPLDHQMWEITASKSMLETALGRQIVSFAYPFGGSRDFNTDTMRLVRDAGFNCACANYPGLATKRNDPYMLPRFLVRNWDGDQFVAQLAAWNVI